MLANLSEYGKYENSTYHQRARPKVNEVPAAVHHGYINSFDLEIRFLVRSRFFLFRVYLQGTHINSKVHKDHLQSSPASFELVCLAMEYTGCEICGEVYFTNDEAKTRHQQMCVAVKGFLSCRNFRNYGISKNFKRHNRSPSPRTSNKKANNNSERNLSSHKTPMVFSSDVPYTTGHGPSSAKDDSSFDKYGASGTPTRQHRSPSPQTSNKKANNNLEQKLSSLKTPMVSYSNLPYTLRKGLSSAKDYRIENPGFYNDMEPFLDDALKTAAEILRNELITNNSLKYNIVFEAVYNHPSTESEEFNFKTSSKTLFSVDQNTLQEKLEEDKEKLISEESALQEKNSGWSFELPTSLTVRVSLFKYKAPKGRAYLELPKKIEQAKGYYKRA